MSDIRYRDVLVLSKKPEVNDDLLIAAVRKQTLIWDPTHTDYRNRNQRMSAWATVLLEIGVINNEPNSVLVRRRWDYLRTAFLKSRAPGPNGTVNIIKHFKHSKAMQFLADHVEHKDPRPFTSLTLNMTNMDSCDPLTFDEREEQTTDSVYHDNELYCSSQPSTSPPPIVVPLIEEKFSFSSVRKRKQDAEEEPLKRRREYTEGDTSNERQSTPFVFSSAFGHLVNEEIAKVAKKNQNIIKLKVLSVIYEAQEEDDVDSKHGLF